MGASVPMGGFEQLLVKASLYSAFEVKGVLRSSFGELNWPDYLRLHCAHENCAGVRRHWGQEGSKTCFGDSYYHYRLYKCSNCGASGVVFGIKTTNLLESGSATVVKIYQEPPFGSPIPPKLFSVIGEENRLHFLNARRAIARGLGIGAYSYYRRIVENSKFNLVNSVLQVARETCAPVDQINKLEQARDEVQFSKAVKTLGEVNAIPPVLLISGHNPLMLLHNLLSEGIHAFSDEECLSRSKDAETILIELTERIQIAVSEKREVAAAVANVLRGNRG